MHMRSCRPASARAEDPSGACRSAAADTMMGVAGPSVAPRHLEEPMRTERIIDFQTEPSRYRHWKLKVDGEIATLLMDVDEKSSLFEGYDLKLNSYDLGVDIELADAIERIRFEHPAVRVVLLRSGKPRVFCAGANIRML